MKKNSPEKKPLESTQILCRRGKTRRDATIRRDEEEKEEKKKKKKKKKNPERGEGWRRCRRRRRG